MGEVVACESVIGRNLNRLLKVRDRLVISALFGISTGQIVVGAGKIGPVLNGVLIVLDRVSKVTF